MADGTTLTNTSSSPAAAVSTFPKGKTKDEWIEFFEESDRATQEMNARWGDGRPPDGIIRACVLPNSSHRDGSIYSDTEGWHQEYRIADTTETQLEPMIFSNPTRCYPNQEYCTTHHSGPMLQIFSLKLASVSSRSCEGPVQVYGYIAARDTRDALRNYVFNRTRYNPVMLEPGSLIQMTGPKRGICMHGDVLIEYDMRIKKEDHQDDLQLIDGVSDYDQHSILSCHPFLNRIDGVGGAVDMTLALFYNAVEATIQLNTTRVNGSASRLLLNCFVSGFEEEIQLFHGNVRQIPERFVVSTVVDTLVRLKFKFGDERGSHSNEFERSASFRARRHGCASQQIKLDEEDYIMVKVNWSTL